MEGHALGTDLSHPRIRSARAIYWSPAEIDGLSLLPTMLRLHEMDGTHHLLIGGLALGLEDPLTTLRMSARLSARWGLPLTLFRSPDGRSDANRDLARFGAELAGGLDALSAGTTSRQAIDLTVDAVISWRGPDGGLSHWATVLRGPGPGETAYEHATVIFDPDPHGRAAPAGSLIHAAMLLGPWPFPMLARRLHEMVSESSDSAHSPQVWRPNGPASLSARDPAE